MSKSGGREEDQVIPVQKATDLYANVFVLVGSEDGGLQFNAK